MNSNAYEPPGSPAAAGYAHGAPNRTLLVLAAVGAWLASAYWAALTLLLGFGVASGTVSGTRIFLPGVLIALYAWRGVQLFKGDAAAARRILWLHGAGGAIALFQMISGGGPLLMALQGIKVAIHVFGLVTAYLAMQSVARPR